MIFHETAVCVYVYFRNTLGLVLTSVFQYFYFLLQKYWENFYLSNFFQST